MVILVCRYFCAPRVLCPKHSVHTPQEYVNGIQSVPHLFLVLGIPDFPSPEGTPGSPLWKHTQTLGGQQQGGDTIRSVTALLATRYKSVTLPSRAFHTNLHFKVSAAPSVFDVAIFGCYSSQFHYVS